MSKLREVILGEIAEFQEGYVNPPQSKSQYFDGPIKWLRAVDLNNSFVSETSRTLTEDGYRSAGKSAYLFPPDTLAISKSGTIGRLGIIKDWMCGNRAVINIRPLNDLVDTRYVFYALLSDPAQIDVLAEGSVQRNLYVSQLSTFKVPLPELAEQRRIVQLLGSLDDKIELNRRMNETLEAMARAIFKDWFVDFGPTRAKAEGRAPYLAPKLWDLFPDTFDDEDKPAGWGSRKLEDFLELAYGKSLPAKKRAPGNVAVYGSGGLAGTHDTALIEGPAVIVGRKGTVGSLYWEDGPAFPIDTVFYAVPRIGSILFSYHLLDSQPLADMNTDAAVPGLNRSNVYRLEFPLPTSDLMLAFEDVTGALWQRRAENLREIETLTQTRGLLLPKLMSGEIRLREAEKAVEAVA